MRLVDVDELKKQMCNECFGGNCGNRCYEWTLMNNAPTVDPVKHGHWVNKGLEPLRCSECGIMVDTYNGIPWACKSFVYCPHCGAMMNEVKDETD